MIKWQQQRQVLLALTFASVFFTIGRFSLDRTVGNRPLAPLTFPSVVPLAGWQLLESRPQAEPIASNHKTWATILASQKYSYKQNISVPDRDSYTTAATIDIIPHSRTGDVSHSNENRYNQQMEIEMRYVVSTFGDLDQYFKYFVSMNLQEGQLLQNLRQHEGVGFYSLFVYQGRSHLSACINPRGGSTVTSTQFFANQYTYELQLRRLVPWLLGKESLLDKRCLWADLSIPLNNKQSAETTYPVLEQAWWSWYKWWSPRFPQLH